MGQRRDGAPRGRPVVTSRAAIEQAAFRLFAQHGFDGTTLGAIAAELGIGKRTLFHYYPSKNDIPWGAYGDALERFRALLADAPHDVPAWQAIHGCVVELNRLEEDSGPSHRERMSLILGTPSLQAYSALKYTEWRGVIQEHVARRFGLAPTDLLPRVAGRTALALSISAYEVWLESPAQDHAQDMALLEGLMSRSMAALRHYLSDDRPPVAEQ